MDSFITIHSKGYKQLLGSGQSPVRKLEKSCGENLRVNLIHYLIFLLFMRISACVRHACQSESTFSWIVGLHTSLLSNPPKRGFCQTHLSTEPRGQNSISAGAFLAPVHVSSSKGFVLALSGPEPETTCFLSNPFIH